MPLYQKITIGKERRIIDYSDRLDTYRNKKKKRSYKQEKKEDSNQNPGSSEGRNNDVKEQHYRNSEEKWGKRDPETPKSNPKLGQFQQSPKIPLSEQPDLKTKSSAKKKKNNNHEKLQTFPRKRKSPVVDTTHGKPDEKQNKTSTISEKVKIKKKAEKCMVTEDKKREDFKKQTKSKSRRRLGNAACRAVRKRLTEWIYNHEANDKEDTTDEETMCVKNIGNKRQRVSSIGTDRKKKRIARFGNVVCASKSDPRFVGLQNKKNDCWLNTLVQCINNLPLRICLLDAIKAMDDSALVTALTNVLSEMNSVSSGAIYPTQLHEALQIQLNYARGEQNDIHEIFTTLCCTQDYINETIASHFQVGVQFRKTCSYCLTHEDGPPETFTSIPLSVQDGKPEVENSIANFLHENISIVCPTCKVLKPHAREGRFVFLPNTLALVFKRFSYVNDVQRKKHSIVDLKEEMVISDSESSYYSLKACALHHGEHIHNGHYTALIFDQDKVLEVDDEQAFDRTADWKEHAGSTVYLAFYTKQDDYDNKTDVETPDKGDSNIRENQDYIEKREIDETELLWDVSRQNSLICNVSKFGYELKGRDFKSLEHPVVNNSYRLKSPGWLNDNIIDAYISLLVKAAASDKGMRVHAFNCFFMKRLREVLLKKRCEGDLHKMLVNYHKRVIFEALEYLIIPINTDDKHWTVVFIDIWMARIFFYDPMYAGSRNETDIGLIKFYFEQFFGCNSYEVKILEKRFVIDFDVIWEKEFACQSDCASCGVYVLMYASHKLGLLNRDPLTDDIYDVRKEFVCELYRGKKFMASAMLKEPHKLKKRCSTASRYKQQVGKKVVLHCYSSYGSKVTFVWSFNGVAVSTSQTYEFLLSKDQEGEYICYVDYGNNVVLKSRCTVECTTSKSEEMLDHKDMLNSLKKAIEWNFTKR